MINLPRSHPAYSLAGELLCLLPRRPVLTSKVLADLGLEFLADLYPVMEAARREYGVSVRVMLCGNGRRVEVKPGQWDDAKAAGGRYWASVYGGEGEG